MVNGQSDSTLAVQPLLFNPQSGFPSATRDGNGNISILPHSKSGNNKQPESPFLDLKYPSAIIAPLEKLPNSDIQPRGGGARKKSRYGGRRCKAKRFCFRYANKNPLLSGRIGKKQRGGHKNHTQKRPKNICRILRGRRAFHYFVLKTSRNCE